MSCLLSLGSLDQYTPTPRDDNLSKTPSDSAHLLPACMSPGGSISSPGRRGGGGRGAVVLPRNLTNRSSRLSHQDEQPSGSHWQISAPSRPRRVFPSILRLSHQSCRICLAMEFYREKRNCIEAIRATGLPPPLPRPNRASIPTRQPLELVT